MSLLKKCLDAQQSKYLHCLSAKIPCQMKKLYKESEATGTTGTASVANNRTGLFDDKLVKRSFITNPKDFEQAGYKIVKFKKSPFKSVLTETVLASDIAARLGAYHRKSHITPLNSTSYAIEDKDGNIIKITVSSDDEERLESLLQYAVNRADRDLYDIGEIIYDLQRQVNILDVVWHEAGKEDYEMMSQLINEDASDTLNEAPGDEELPSDEELLGDEGSDIDAAIEVDAATMEGEDLGDGSEETEGVDFGFDKEEVDPQKLLLQVLELLTVEAEARKAEARKAEEEAERERSRLAIEHTEQLIKQAEQTLDIKHIENLEKQEGQLTKDAARVRAIYGSSPERSADNIDRIKELLHQTSLRTAKSDRMHESVKVNGFNLITSLTRPKATLGESAEDDVNRLTNELNNIDKQIDMRTRPLTTRKDVLARQLASAQQRAAIEASNKEKEAAKEAEASQPKQPQQPAKQSTTNSTAGINSEMA